MIKLKTILAIVALTTLSAFAGTFQTIRFDQETHSDSDPFGVQALAIVSQKVETIQNGLVSKQYVDDELTNYVKLAELQEGIEFGTLEAKSFKIDGQDVSLVGHKHGASEITNLSEVISTQIAGLASETFVTNKMNEYVKKSDVSSAAQTAITGINNATTIEEIQVALTNFLHTLVITVP